MTKSVTLIVSTGAQDVRFWVKHVCGKFNTPCINSVPPFKYNTRDVHLALLNKPDLWQWRLRSGWPEGAAIVKFKNRIEIDKVKSGGFSLECHNSNGQATCNPEPEFLYANDKQKCYLLHPAKLDGLVSALRALIEEQSVTLAGVLVFGTDRGKNNEPIASHRLIARWIAEFCFDDPEKNAEYGVTNNPPDKPVWWVNAASGICNDKDIKFEGKGDDDPLKRVITYTVDESIRAFCDHHQQAEAIPLVAQTGGPGVIKSVISASATLRSGGAAREISLTEFADDDSPKETIKKLRRAIEAPKEHLHPAERLTARHLVMERIRRGDFEGAWAVCAHLDKTVSQNRWIVAVRWVYDYFKRTQAPDKEDSTELKGHYNELRELLETLATGNTVEQQIQRALTHTAFRIEAALTAPSEKDLRIEEALATTGTFNDLLLRASVWQYIDNYWCIGSPVSFTEEIINNPGDILYGQITKSNRKAPICLIDADGVICKIMGDVHNAWRKRLTEDHLTNHFNKRWNKQYKIQTKEISMAKLRNDHIHRMLDKHSRDVIIGVATCNKKRQIPLWNLKLQDIHDGPQDLGKAFLSTGWTNQTEKQFTYPYCMKSCYVKLTVMLQSIVASSVPVE